MPRETVRERPFVVIGHPEKPMSSIHFWIHNVRAATPEKARDAFLGRFPDLPVAKGQVFTFKSYFAPGRGKPLLEWPAKLQKFYVKAVSHSAGTPRTTHTHFEFVNAENALRAIESMKTTQGNVTEASAWKNFSAFRAKKRPAATFKRR